MGFESDLLQYVNGMKRLERHNEGLQRKVETGIAFGVCLGSALTGLYVMPRVEARLERTVQRTVEAVKAVGAGVAAPTPHPSLKRITNLVDLDAACPDESTLMELYVTCVEDAS